jgi:hypothetical protein
VPRLEGETLTERKRALPETGRAALLVIGFSKDAAPSMVPWLSACRSRDPHEPPAVGCYDVRMLQAVPGLFRGFVARAMRKEYPQEWKDDALLVYKDNDSWQRRLRIRDPKAAQVLLIDAEGRVAAMADGEGGGGRLADLLRALEPRPTPEVPGSPPSSVR